MDHSNEAQLSATSRIDEIQELRLSHERLNNSVSGIQNTLATIVAAVSRLTAVVQTGSLTNSVANDPIKHTHDS